MNIPGGVSGLSRLLHCSVGYLSRVERGTADGPSSKFLEEVSRVLDVDLKRLVQMKEQDNAAGRDQADGTASEGQSETRAGFAPRQLAELVAPRRQEPAPQRERMDVGGLSLRADLASVAAAHLDISEKLLKRKGYTDEALAEQHKALAVFETLEDWGGAAFSCFNVARIYRRLALDQTESPVDRLGHLLEAGSWLERAYKTFTGHLDDLSDEYLRRRTECLMQWARVGRTGRVAGGASA